MLIDELVLFAGNKQNTLHIARESLRLAHGLQRFVKFCTIIVFAVKKEIRN